MSEKQILCKWDRFKALEKVADVFDDYEFELFRDFLRKVDSTGQQGLIEGLFGSEEAYIESHGGYHKDEAGYEHSIIYNFTANGYGLQLLKLFIWFLENEKKAVEWMNKGTNDEEHKHNADGLKEWLALSESALKEAKDVGWRGILVTKK